MTTELFQFQRSETKNWCHCQRLFAASLTLAGFHCAWARVSDDQSLENDEWRPHFIPDPMLDYTASSTTISPVNNHQPLFQIRPSHNVPVNNHHFDNPSQIWCVTAAKRRIFNLMKKMKKSRHFFSLLMVFNMLLQLLATVLVVVALGFGGGDGVWWGRGGVMVSV